ncbi:MAG: radical SAM protein [Candidatus Woesebacteria bacterium]|jgi:MoaA/NifB/PqqE/SkfB family radical SAM enzyme
MTRLIKLTSKTIERLFFALLIKIKRKLKLSTKPLFINFAITYQCNSRCQMCRIWKKYQQCPSLLKKELSAKDIKNFVSKNQNFLADVKSIGLTGGEAILRKDIVKIVRTLHRYLPKARIGIQTNGLNPSLIEEKLKIIKKFYPKISLAISLDGIAQTHDQIRGVKNAFKNFKKTAKVAQELKIKDLTSGLTINKKNIEQIEAVADLVESLGFEFSCFLADESDFYFNNRGQKKLRLDQKSRKKLIGVLKKFNYHYFMDNLRLQLEKKTSRTLACYSGYTSIVIDPYGDVRACILRSEIFGNIKNKQLKNILFDQHGWQVRKKLEGCSCWSQCEVSTSAIVDVFDTVKWFIKYADKKMFLKKLMGKLHRL